MIASSRFAAVVCLACAAGVHLASVLRIGLDEEIQIESGQGAAVAALGSAFTDMVQGVQTPEPVEDIPDRPDPDRTETPQPDEVTDQAEPDETAPEEVDETARQPEPDRTEADRPEEVAESARPDDVTNRARPEEIATPREPDPARVPRPVKQDVPDDPSKTARTEPATAVRAAPEPAVLAALSQSTTAPTVALLAPVETPPAPLSQPPVETLMAEKVLPETVAALDPTALSPVAPVAAPVAVPPAEMLAAAEPDTTTPAVSKRPRRRSESFEQQHKPKRQKKPKKKQKPKPQRVAKAEPKPKPQGNSDRNARQGSVTGSETSNAARQGTRNGRAKAVGNAAISNYPGLVMRRISRVARPRVGARGTAVVAFRVASNGGLSAVSVASSSGSAELDKAAMRVIRKAAPFPAPPSGARRSFTIRIKGR